MRKLLRSILLSICLLLCAPPSAAARDKWTRLRTENFTVVGDASEADMRRLAAELEGFRQTLALLLPKARITTPVGTTVVLFKNHIAFKPFKPRYKGKIREDVGGYFLDRPDGNYIAMTAETRGLPPLHVIFHEYEHFVVRNNIDRAPLWLNEGLAEFYGTFQVIDENRKARLGIAMAHHTRALRNSRMLPLETLLTVDHKSPHYNESDKAGIFYAQSWALVHYLMFGNNAARQEQLTRFIAGLNTDATLEENFRQSFQADYAQIEKELRDYVRKFLFPALDFTFTKPLDAAKDIESRPLSEAEVEHLLGDLLFQQVDRDAEAEARFTKATTLDPKLAPARLSLGLLRLRQSKRAEALSLFDASLALDANNYLAHFYRGVVLRLEGRHDDALEAQQRAIKLRPDIARMHVERALIYSDTDRNPAALAAFNQALRLEPRDTSIYRSRAYTYLRINRGDLAAANALAYLKREGWANDSAPYVALAAYFGHRQARHETQAAELLAEALTKTDAKAWAHTLLRYLRRDLTAEQLLALATDNDKQTEAHAYIGLDLSLAGEPDKALTHLRWVVENGNRDFVEYPLAAAELRRLTAPTDATKTSETTPR